MTSGAATARMVLTMHRGPSNGLCYWCGFLTALTVARAYSFSLECEGRRPQPGDIHRCQTMTRATFDHYKPKSKGGFSSLHNGKLACRWCNQWRGDEDADTFRVRIDALVRAGNHPRQLYRTKGKWPAKFPAKESMVL